MNRSHGSAYSSANQTKQAQATDALLRRHKYGRIRPMTEPGLIARLLGRN